MLMFMTSDSVVAGTEIVDTLQDSDLVQSVPWH